MKSGYSVGWSSTSKRWSMVPRSPRKQAGARQRLAISKINWPHGKHLLELMGTISQEREDDILPRDAAGEPLASDRLEDCSCATAAE